MRKLFGFGVLAEEYNDKVYLYANDYPFIQDYDEEVKVSYNLSEIGWINKDTKHAFLYRECFYIIPILLEYGVSLVEFKIKFDVEKWRKLGFKPFVYSTLIRKEQEYEIKIEAHTDDILDIVKFIAKYVYGEILKPNSLSAYPEDGEYSFIAKFETIREVQNG